MRKNTVLAILMVVMLVFSCAGTFAEETADETICTYVVYNVTGETVTELYLIDGNSGEKSENYAGEEGLADLGVVEITGENYEGYVKTLAFKTESGYEAEFTTLHFENEIINLLAPDAMTGATPISFSMLPQE